MTFCERCADDVSSGVAAGGDHAVAVENERRRIGNELHDGVQHHIVAALLCVRMFEREASRGRRGRGRLLVGAADGLVAALDELDAVLVDPRSDNN